MKKAPTQKQISAAWKKACAHLQKTIPPDDYTMWVDPLLLCVEGDFVIIETPDPYCSSWIQDHFDSAIIAALSLTALNGLPVAYRVTANQPQKTTTVGRLPPVSPPSPQKNIAIGFMIKGLIQAGLPHKKVRGTEYSHTNGRWTLTVQGRKKYGVPYGAIPRLVLVWLITEIHQSKSTRVVLGNSFSSFMKKVGLLGENQKVTGGTTGNIPRIKKQIISLLSSSFHLEDNEKPKGFAGEKSVSLLLSKERQLWWDTKNPGQATFFDSYIEISQEFYDLVMSERIPIDINALKEIKRSSMAIDVLFWLTLKTFTCKDSVFIPWESLRQQFSPESDPARLNNFKASFLPALKKVQGLYTQLTYKTTGEGLTLKTKSPLLPLKPKHDKI